MESLKKWVSDDGFLMRNDGVNESKMVNFKASVEMIEGLFSE